MDSRTLNTLPPELLTEILGYLPPTALLSFGTTCRENHRLASVNFRTLSLGIFHSRIASMVSSSLEEETPRCVPSYRRQPKKPRMDSWSRESSPEADYVAPASSHPHITHRHDIVLPRTVTQTRDAVLRAQSNISATIISRYANSLRSLELHVWELSEQTARAIASCTRLKHLSIRMDHVGTRHQGLASGTWDTAMGSSAWNHLATSVSSNSPSASPKLNPRRPNMSARAKSAPTVPQNPRHNGLVVGSGLKKLESLRLERSGLTDYQLQSILAQNPNLKHLYLRKCTALTPHLFRWMARTPAVKSRIQTLQFSHHEIGVRPSSVVQMAQEMSLDVLAGSEEQAAMVQKLVKDVFCPVSVLGPLSQFPALVDLDLTRVNGIDANSVRKLGIQMALPACIGGWEAGKHHIGPEQAGQRSLNHDSASKIEVDERYQ